MSSQSESFLKMSKHNIQKTKNIYGTETSGERCPVFTEEGLDAGEEGCEPRCLGGGASPVGHVGDRHVLASEPRG